jgi:N12 class adenine-specific DNA methylase
VDALYERFRSWIWEDSYRAADIIEITNRKFYNLAPRFFNGSHLTLPVMTTAIQLYEHQKRAIWAHHPNRQCYLAHAVRRGKQLSHRSRMEMRLLGLLQQPLYLSQSHAGPVSGDLY